MTKISLYVKKYFVNGGPRSERLAGGRRQPCESITVLGDRARGLGGRAVGVLSTYCQVCGLPVQHDHYVPQPDSRYLRIWRGDGDDGCEPAFAFGPEHGWLRRAVGLRLAPADADVVIEG